MSVRRVNSLIRFRRRAFTLIELVVCIVVGSIISGSAGMILINAAQINFDAACRGELYDLTATSMEMMMRYIREIPQDECSGSSSPCLNGNAQVTLASATELRFGNPGFRQNGSNLEMTANNGTNWFALTSDLRTLTFAYYDRTGTALTTLPLSSTDRAKIRRVQITLSLSRGSTTISMRTTLYLRAFMNEVFSDP